jgi:hypothetical protein
MNPLLFYFFPRFEKWMDSNHKYLTRHFQLRVLYDYFLRREKLYKFVYVVLVVFNTGTVVL